MKRQRGRGRKSNGGGGQHNQHRNFESNGPDIKIRGSASHVYDKYQQLARDASSAGDRVAAENYLQHAEHYFRVLRSQQQHQRERAEEAGQRDQQGGGYQGGNYQNGRDDFDDASGPADQAAAGSGAPGPLDVVDPEAAGQAGSQSAEGRDDDRARRHRRRRRYEGGGPGQGPNQGQGQPAEAGDAPSASFDRAPST